MSTSNVRNIDSLIRFHAGLKKLSDNWGQLAEEIQASIHRCDEFFSQSQPAYWRRQMQLAERELTEAKDSLAQKRAVARAGDRPAASEAVKRVRLAERRQRVCEDKQRAAKAIAIEIKQQCDRMLGPLSDLVEHCEVVLPHAAVKLQSLIDQLKLYAEKADKVD